jgi:hypothetical protein
MVEYCGLVPPSGYGHLPTTGVSPDAPNTPEGRYFTAAANPEPETALTVKSRAARPVAAQCPERMRSRLR